MSEQGNESLDTEQQNAPVAKYSLGAVLARGVQNIKDDFDPFRKGVKAGLFFFHAIPTWIRQHQEGKMSDGGGWAKVSGTATGIGVGTAYAVGTMELLNAYGKEGYMVAAVPVLANGVSYVYEAFKRGKKDVLEELVLTNVTRVVKADGSNRAYDLTCKQMVEKLTQGFYENSLRDHIRQNTSQTESEFVPTEETKTAFRQTATEQAKDVLYALSLDVFDGLVADGRLGKEYELSHSLKTGPEKRKQDRKRQRRVDYMRTLDYGCHVPLQEMIRETVETNGGTATVELFGTLTAVYKGKDELVRYLVKPSALWKVK